MFLQRVRHWVRQARKLVLIRWVRWRRAWRGEHWPDQAGLFVPSLRFLDQDISLVARCALVASLVKTFEELGYTPHLWLRGQNARQTRLFHELSSHEGNSDEIFFLSQTAPLWVCRSPENASTAARHAGATALILIEPREEIVERSHLVVVAAEREFSLATASKKHLRTLSHSDAFLVLEASSERLETLRQIYPATYAASWGIAQNPLSEETSVVAFTGLKDSGAFYHALRGYFKRVEGFVPISYKKDRKEKTVHALAQMASRQGARLVTTHRDAYFLSAKMSHNVTVLPLCVNVEEGFLQTLVERGFGVFSHKDPEQTALPSAQS